MDKTISISLGGYSFIIDDAAYRKLKTYLDRIRHSLNNMEGTDDIISDIEVRIAELFRENMGFREVVNTDDVDRVVEVMGKPEQYVDEGDTENFSDAGSTAFRSTAGEPKKKLYRDPDDKILGGVLSGIAHYLGIETWIARLIWVGIFFFDGFLSFTSFTVISYIVLWIILPKATTASQKYEMYGQAGDIESIKKNLSSPGATSSARSGAGEAVSVIGKIILFFIGFMLIMTGLGLLISSLVLLFTFPANIPVKFFDYVFDYSWQDWLSKILLITLFAVPAVLLIALGARFISSRFRLNRGVAWGAVGMWFAALIGIVFLAGSVAKNYTKSIETSDRKAFTVDSDTITLTFNDHQIKGSKKIKMRGIVDVDMGGLTEFNGRLHREVPERVEIRETDDDQVSVEILDFSRGSSLDNAQKNAEAIEYEYFMNPNGELFFNNYLSLPKDAKFRDQNVNIIVYIPKGKVIHSKNLKNLIFGDDNSNSKNYRKGKNKFYRFADNNPECLNCETNKKKDNTILEFKDSDNTEIKITPEGVKIQSGSDKVIIDKQQINITDGTDSVDINISGD